ncbi:hypothetical protein RRG08_016650 [Elysia crispata]|uniref:Carboxylic ester hydrolase n=1 Tax=Elysia crispata TaxID=231223 RepID=A0AAE1D8S2_9GAST|nr:hypothetical protein RRG08_016650 [Elysia crispata]
MNPAGSLTLVLDLLLLVTAQALVDEASTKDLPRPVRVTLEGPVVGYLHRLACDGGISERYLGIPFAAPPLGTRRFQRPSPARVRTSPLVATSHPPACMQANHETIYISDYMPHYGGSMDEDCLYLNIYLPHIPQTQQDSNQNTLLPVLVHIHGGSNEVGSSSMFQPDALAVLGNMVVVTVNYRLGALGFLSVPQVGIHGNMGLWDQVMALTWLRDNIENFGGDHTNVTLQGHSAGAVDVGLHVISPVSKGLFRYAVLQSGSPLALWAILPAVPIEEKQRGPGQHLDILGCPHTSNKSRTLDCLQSVDVHKIVDAFYKHGPDFYRWSATVDGHFLPATPTVLLSNKSNNTTLNAKNIMVGLVRDEGSLTAEAVAKNKMFRQQYGRSPTFEEVTNDRSHVTDPPLFKESDFYFDLEYYGNIASIRELSAYAYFPWSDPANSTGVIRAFSDYAGDITFVAPAVEFLRRITTPVKTMCYMYVFDHRSRRSRFPAWMGSIHGEDLAYVFGCPLDGQCGREFNSEDQELSRRVIQMWSNFAHTGLPTVGDALWPPSPYHVNQTYIIIGTTPVNSASDNNSNSNNSKGNCSTTIPTSLLPFPTAQRFRARYTRFWNDLLPDFKNSPHVDTSSESKAYRVATLVLTVSLVAITFGFVVVLSILVRVLKKQHIDKEKRLDPAGGSSSLL